MPYSLLKLIFILIITILKLNGLFSNVLVRPHARKLKDDLEVLEEISKPIIGKYPRYNEILLYIKQLCSFYPNIVQTHPIGNSSEGRMTLVLQLGIVRNRSKWGVWMDGGIHGREHISPATIMYILYKFIQGYLNGNTEIIQALKHLDWYMLPVFNPDGYEYTFTHNRMWRKNRRRIKAGCIGVDLNRNWNYSWGGTDSSSDPCSENYKGPRAESEPEIQNVVRFILSRSSFFIAFLSYHSYGQKIMTYCEKETALYEDFEIISLANKMVDALAYTNGKFYKLGKAEDIAYPFGGSSTDWARMVAGIKFSYLIELRDEGKYGFLLPVSEIIPTGEENLASVLVLAKRLNLIKTRQKSKLGIIENLSSDRYAIKDEIWIVFEKNKLTENICCSLDSNYKKYSKPPFCLNSSTVHSNVINDDLFPKKRISNANFANPNLSRFTATITEIVNFSFVALLYIFTMSYYKNL